MIQLTSKRASVSLWLAALAIAAAWLASAALPASAQTCKDYGGTFTCPPTPPSTTWGNVCGTAPSYYCSYAAESCAFNEIFDCQSCSCKCDTATYPCAGCTAASSTPGAACSPPINGVYQDACGTCTCDTGYQVCPSTNTCVAVAACPVGTTFDPCTGNCTSPYILRSPASPQVGYIDIVGYMEATGYLDMGGDITSGGDLTVANDVYMTGGKAIRLDDSADTQLNIGNFGGGRADLSVQGRLGVGHLDVPSFSIDVRSSTSTPMINLKDEGLEWTGLRLSRDSAAGAGGENWFVGMNATDQALRFRGGSSDDWLVITDTGQSQFFGDMLLAPDLHFRLSPGAQPAGGSVGDGSMYYDLTDDKFKCYEGGGWKDCVTDGAAVGSGIGPQVAVWQGDGSLGGDSDFTWIDTTNRLNVNSASSANPPRIQMATTSADTPNLPGPGLTFTTGAAGGGYMLKMQQGGGDYFAVSDETGNTNYLVVDSAGNVGIGDATPSNTLDVNGSIGVGDQTVISAGRAIQNISGYGQTSGNFSFSGAGNFSVASSSLIDLSGTTAVSSGNAFILSPGAAPTAAEGGMYYDSTEQKFKCYEGTPGSGGSWVNCAGSGGSVGGSGGADRVAFWNATDELSSASDFKWVDATKRLGLGATNPLYGLDLRSASSALLSVDDTAGGNYAGLRVARTGLERWFVGMDDAGLFQLRRDSATNDLTIDGSGNVGIGDGSPTNKLDVAGSIGIGDTTVVTASRAIENTTGYSQSSGNFAVAGAGSFATSSGAVTLAGNTRVSDGKTFRIGAFSTASEPAGQPGMMYYNTDTNKFRCFEGAGWKDCGGQSGATFGSGADGQVAYWSGSNQLTGENAFFYDQATDRLGLGTTAPGFSLDIVQPSGSVTNTAMIRLHQDNATRLWTGLRLDRTGSDEQWFIGMDSGDNDLLFRGAGVNRMVVSAAGNVGIGNETPANKLDVTGQVNSTGGYAVGGTNVVSAARALQNVTGYTQTGGGFSVSGGGTANFGTGDFNITSGTFDVSGNSTFAGTVNINNHLTLGSGRYLLLSPGGNPQPSPTAGMMYYDSVADKFRCAQGSPPSWIDCIADTGGSTITGGGVANQVAYWSGASTLTGSNNLYFTGTRLGITETAPGFPLDVAPTGGDLPIIRLHAPSGSGNLYTGLRLDRDKGVEQWFIGLDNVDNTLKFRRSATNPMVITTGGNVGINVGAPTDRLAVGGNVGVTGTTTTNNLVTNTFKMGTTTDGYVLTYDVATGQGLWKEAPGGSFPTIGAAGETIYSDGATWQSDTTLYNDGSKIVLGPQAGTVRVGVGIDNPVVKFQVLNGDVQFSPLAGADSIYDTGPRLTWYDSVSAFRAGTSSTAWDNSTKIGNNSVAFNYNTLASGTNSFAVGYSTQAVGNAAFSAGWLSEANGNYSTAMGYNSQVTGAGSVGIGYFADTGGSYSVAIGKYVTANATNSLVFGKGGDLAAEDLSNNISDSIMMGVGYTAPTVFIGKSPNSSDTYGRVGLGNTNPQAVLDVTGTFRLSGAMTTDPVGASDGTMYYNSSTNTFRCYTSGAWADCMGGGGGGGSSLPAGTLDQTLRHNGTTWEATADLLVSLAGQLDFSGGLSSGNGCTVYTDGNMACSGTIQSTGGSLVGDLLTLNPTSAPSTASDGMVYYDDTLDKFQCRENGAWVDCISSAGATLPAATAGMTLRYDGVAWQSNDVIYNDGTNVGIGETSPSSKLHVVSASTTNPALYSESFQHDGIKGRTTADGKTAVVGDASGTGSFGFYGYAPNGWGGQFQGKGGVVGIGTDWFGGSFTSVNEAALYASSTNGYGAIIENGSVGIGTIAPAYDLDVNGQANATEICIAGDCRAVWPAAGSTLPTGTANDTLRYNGSDWVTSGVLTNDGSAQVGINNSSPGFPLDITGSASTANINLNDQNGTPLWTGLRLARGGSGSGTERWFMGMTNSASNFFVLRRNGNDNVMGSYPDDGGRTFFSATNPAGGSPMTLMGRFDSNNDPKSVLSIMRVTPPGGAVGAPGIGVSIDLMAEADSGSAYDTARITGTFTDVTVGSLDSTLSFYTYDNQVFSERLTIDDDGQVGINTTSPAYQLDVNGQANASELCIAGDCRATWPSGGGSLPAGAANQTLRHNGSDWVASSTLINTGTNVGIGVASPNNTIQVAGLINFPDADYSTYLGSGAGNGITANNDSNTVVGYQAVGSGNITDSGDHLTVVGESAGYALTSGESNTLVGSSAATSLTSGSANVAVGRDSLYYNQVGSNNVAVGFEALKSSSGASVSNATAVGFSALAVNQANYVVAVGANALASNSLGSLNTAVGSYAAATTWFANGITAVGYEAFRFGLGSSNTAIGYHALYNTSSGSSNTAVGYLAGESATGGFVTAIGESTLRSATGVGNTAVGSQAGFEGTAVTTGTYNTLLGYRAGVGTATLDRAVAIGYNAKVNQDDAIVLGDSTNANVAVGIGLTAPSYKLDVNGQINGTELCIAGDCRATWPSGGGSLPAGTVNQTLRHSGGGWVATGGLVSTGTRVGINTGASPGYALDIYDNDGSATLPMVRLADQGTAGYTGLRLDRTAGTEKWFVGMSGSNDDLVIDGNSGLISMSIKNDTGMSSFYAVDPPSHAMMAYGRYTGNNNTVQNVLNVVRSTAFGTPGANGIGAAINLSATADNNGVYNAGRITAAFSDVTVGSLNSTMSFITHTDSFFSEKMFIDGIGNVGIGTTSPDNFKLEVDGSVGPTVDDTFDLGSPTRRWRDIYLGPSSLHIGPSSLDEMVLNYQSGKLNMGPFVVDTVNGRIGIGDLNPASTLSVNGTVAALGGNSSQWNTAYGWGNHASQGYLKGTVTSNYVPRSIGSNTVTTGIIYDNGSYVGISTTASGYKLNVNGTINASQLCINGSCQSTWPGGGGGLSGSGTTNYIPRWTGSGSLGNSIIYQNTSTNRVSLGYLANPTNPWAQLDVRSALCGMTTCGPAIQGTHQWDQPGVRGQSYYGTGVVGVSTNGGDGLSGSGYRGVYGSGTVGVYGYGSTYGVSGWSDSGEGLAAATATGHAIHFHVNNSAAYGLYGESGKVFLQDAVGIGTTSIGTYKLNVNGTVNGTQLCINGSCRSSWPSGGGVTSVNAGSGISVSPTTGAVTVSSTDTLATVAQRGGTTNYTIGVYKNSSYSGYAANFTGYNNDGIRVYSNYNSTSYAAVYAQNTGGGYTFMASGGKNYFSSYTGIGSYPDTNYMLTVKNSGRGIYGQSTGGSYAIYGVTSSSSTSVGAVYGYNSSGFGVLSGTRLGFYSSGGGSLTYVCYSSTTPYTFGTCSSSIRYKENVTTKQVDGEAIYKLRPVDFKWKERDEWGIGYIAEEVADIIPDVITYDKENQVDGINYPLLTLYITDALKKLDTRTVQLAPDGSVALPGDLVAEDNVWGRSSGWISCPEEGTCSCPDGYYMTELQNRGELIKCNEL